MALAKKLLNNVSFNPPTSSKQQTTHLRGPAFGRFGYAHFDSLYIKKAGVGYRLGFNATGLPSSLEGDSYVESDYFTVGIGPAYRLGMDDDILNGTIVSGSPFKDQVSHETPLSRSPMEEHDCNDTNPTIAWWGKRT